MELGLGDGSGGGEGGGVVDGGGWELQQRHGRLQNDTYIYNGNILLLRVAMW